jgi:uncharacterized membrane protein YadS
MGGDRRTRVGAARTRGIHSSSSVVTQQEKVMAQGSLALPRVEPFRPFNKLVQFVPGVVLLAAIGLLGKLIEQSIATYAKSHHLHLPNIEYVLWAILIGLVIGNTIDLPKIFEAGVGSYEFFLKAGIVLLGARFLLGDVAKLGGISLVLVAVELLLSIAFMAVLGRLFGLNPKLTSLLAVGS